MTPKEKFIARLRKHETGFSAGDRKIADYLIHAYPGGMLETATEMSRKIGLNVSTITRFFPKVGFLGIREAQEEFRKELDFLSRSPLDRYHRRDESGEGAEDISDRAWKLDLANLQRTYQGMSRQKVELFIDLVSGSRSAIYIIGERKTFALSSYLFVQMHILHPRVIHVKTDQSMIADLIINVQPDDVLIVFDFRRYPKVNIELARIFRRIGGKIVLIGDSVLSPSSKLADLQFVVESKGVSIFDSYTAGVALINSLLARLTQSRGDYVRERYERLEEYYRQFDIFSSQQGNINMSKLPSKTTRTQRESPHD
jgi:DNA-binding MurR/RpiR family transcriptional regulator